MEHSLAMKIVEWNLEDLSFDYAQVVICGMYKTGCKRSER